MVGCFFQLVIWVHNKINGFFVFWWYYGRINPQTKARNTVYLVFFRGIFSCQLGDEQKNYQSHPLRICHFTPQIDLETAKNFRYPKWRVSKSPKILGYLEVVKLPLHKPYPYSLYRFSDSSILGTTPWKIDMEPTNHPFRKGNSSSKPPGNYGPC